MLEIQNLYFSYKRKQPLFEDFSLSLPDGCIVGLLGKNGAGKTTLLNIVSGLLPPQAGKIAVNGFTPFERKPAFLADVSLIAEEFSLPQVSIAAYTSALQPLYPKFDGAKLDKILAEFELSRANRLHKLSHGQRKKFLIAFALASNCRLLILDEPTNGLDIPSKSQFRKILVSSITDEQTVLISTHQVRDIENIIDSIAVLDNGRAVFADTLENLSRRFRFELADTLPTNALYAEKSIGGQRVILPNDADSEETEIDLELFFNFITNKTYE
ncbi:MAG: ABC transporter ATP-binding protein [Dysgonamonadaceae bacterium]|jgi:ABC-2 type transport system ATP-binding protein|nr:ABC transporter ATP-binding protein [Dysgonamonadaceae bacterium]